MDRGRLQQRTEIHATISLDYQARDIPANNVLAWLGFQEGHATSVPPNPGTARAASGRVARARERTIGLAAGHAGLRTT
jgi:hypothetical protein